MTFRIICVLSKAIKRIGYKWNVHVGNKIIKKTNLNAYIGGKGKIIASTSEKIFPWAKLFERHRKWNNDILHCLTEKHKFV